MSSDWRHRAACREEDPELFFPVGDTPHSRMQAEEAKQVCSHCPAINDCLQWALDNGKDEGVWGGSTEDERRAMKRRAGKPPAACGTQAAYRRHQDRGEPCLDCETAHQKRQQPKPRKLAGCGTRAAYRRHHKNGEPIDEACRLAKKETDRLIRHTGSSKKQEVAA